MVYKAISILQLSRRKNCCTSANSCISKVWHSYWL